ncbi:zinc-finger of the MIZ type in Nse subunit-domain-containing protein [Catenaria anguillulae PL171]|uniref:Zinc-finger of the MIZ type in Nse subunit-domain-containing protein n=1 Tax=Catenaria anguillulae PL171 TaxID=765915 RepID=A0A1Y2HKK5_9FUNG|nr:zinc-finger of the MIZ type in Nse subunit-domain-containing protein [Catenaria anguillulae PL171]
MRKLRSLAQFLESDIGKLTAESQDIMAELGTYSELVTQVAFDCADVDNIEQANLLVNKVVPKLDDVVAAVKSSDAALALVADSLKTSLLQEAALREEQENRMDVDGEQSQSQSQSDSESKVKAEKDDKKGKIPDPDDVATSFRAHFAESSTANPPPAPTADGIPTGNLAVAARAKMWELTKDPRFAPGDLDEDDDLMITAEKEDFRDPITAGTFKHPVRSSLCKHRYENHAIRQLIQQANGRTECPVAGCPHYVREDQLEKDPIFERKLKRHLAELEKAKTQGGDEYMELD